jgi:hypothetical protein
MGDWRCTTLPRDTHEGQAMSDSPVDQPQLREPDKIGNNLG